MANINVKDLLSYGAAYITAKDIFSGKTYVGYSGNYAQQGGAWDATSVKQILSGTYPGADGKIALVYPNKQVVNWNDTPWSQNQRVYGATIEDGIASRTSEWVLFKQMMLNNAPTNDVFKDNNYYNYQVWAKSPLTPQVVVTDPNALHKVKTWNWLNNDTNYGPQMFLYNSAATGLGDVKNLDVKSSGVADVVEVKQASTGVGEADTWNFTFVPNASGDQVQTYNKTQTLTDRVSQSSSQSTTYDVGASGTAEVRYKVGNDSTPTSKEIAYSQSWSWNKSVTTEQGKTVERSLESSVQVTFNPGAVAADSNGKYLWSSSDRSNSLSMKSAKVNDNGRISSVNDYQTYAKSDINTDNNGQPSELIPGHNYTYVLEYSKDNYRSGLQHLNTLSGNTSGYNMVNTFHTATLGQNDQSYNHAPDGTNPDVVRLVEGFSNGQGQKAFGLSSIKYWTVSDNSNTKPTSAEKPVLFTNPNNSTEVLAPESLVVNSDLQSNLTSLVKINGNANRSTSQVKMAAIPAANSLPNELSSSDGIVQQAVNGNSLQSKVLLAELTDGQDPTNIGVYYIAGDNEAVVGTSGEDIIKTGNNDTVTCGFGDQVFVIGSHSIIIEDAAQQSNKSGHQTVISSSSDSGHNQIFLSSQTGSDLSLGWGGDSVDVKSSNDFIDCTHSDVSSSEAANIITIEAGAVGNTIGGFLYGYDKLNLGNGVIQSAVFDPATNTVSLALADRSLSIDFDFSHSGFSAFDITNTFTTYLLTKLSQNNGLYGALSDVKSVDPTVALQLLKDYSDASVSPYEFLDKYAFSSDMLNAGTSAITPFKFFAWAAAQASLTGKQFTDVITDTLYSALPHTEENGSNVNKASLEKDIESYSSTIAHTQSFTSILSKISTALQGNDLTKITQDQGKFDGLFYKSILPLLDNLSPEDQQTLASGLNEIVQNVVAELSQLTNGPGESPVYALERVDFSSKNQNLDAHDRAQAFFGVGTGDSVTFSGPISQYKIQNFDAHIEVTDTKQYAVAGLPPSHTITDVLTNVGSIKFSDGVLYINPSEAAHTVYYLAQATTGSTPLSSVFGAWAAAADTSGLSGLGVIDNYMTTSHYATNFGGLSNETFIKAFMQNLFNWAPDQTTISTWSGYLNNGLARDQAIKALIDYADKVELAGLQHGIADSAGLWTV